jgi:hypothetical protein
LRGGAVLIGGGIGGGRIRLLLPIRAASALFDTSSRVAATKIENAGFIGPTSNYRWFEGLPAWVGSSTPSRRAGSSAFNFIGVDVVHRPAKSARRDSKECDGLSGNCSPSELSVSSIESYDIVYPRFQSV